MRVLQVCVGEGKEGGGVGRIARRLSEVLGYALAACRLEKGKRNYPAYKLGCKNLPFFSSVVLPFNLYSTIRRYKPDVIVSHGYGSTLPLFAALIAFFLRIPHIFVIHAYPQPKGIRRIALFIYNLLAFIPIRLSTLAYFSQAPMEKIGGKGKLFTFIPERMFFQKPGKRKYLLFVGRLDENKRPLWFAEICKMSGEEGKVIGIDEGEGKKLKAFASSHGLSLEVEELPLEEMPKAYREAKALITTSEYEGLPLVWLEAIASEVPVFTTPVGDYRRILSWVYGKDWKKFVFSSPKEAVEKLRFLPSLYSLARRAKAKLSKRSWEEEARAFHRFVESVWRGRHDKV